MGKKTILFFRLSVMGFSLWLALFAPAARTMAAGVSCKAWNTPEFFRLAGAADVSRCLGNRNSDARNRFGLTPLQTATMFSETPGVVVILAKAGADVNARDDYGHAPLHMAARFSATPAIVRILLEAGADPAARTRKGQTPRDLMKADSPLGGTDVWRRLNDGRSR